MKRRARTEHFSEDQKTEEEMLRIIKAQVGQMPDAVRVWVFVWKMCFVHNIMKQ